jgi:hypothetical protein
VTLRVAWDLEPFDRACARHRDLWAWLEANGRADWTQIEALASAMHPESRSPGSTVYLQLERNEFKRAWIEACAPWLLRELPPPRRGKRRDAMPTDGLAALLFVSGALAVSEFTRLQEAYRADPRDPIEVARHLYWAERFTSTWERTAEIWRATPRVNRARRSRARAWGEALLRRYMTTHGRLAAEGERPASARAIALSHWRQAGAPNFDAAYRDLLRRIRQA